MLAVEVGALVRVAVLDNAAVIVGVAVAGGATVVVDVRPAVAVGAGGAPDNVAVGNGVVGGGAWSSSPQAASRTMSSPRVRRCGRCITQNPFVTEMCGSAT
jgi:hypothetical protein